MSRDACLRIIREKEINTCAAISHVCAAYGELDVVHHRECTSCSLSLKLQVTGLLYGESVAPALESDCRNSDCIFHVSDHLLHLLVCIDWYQMHIRVLECKYTKYFICKRLANGIHIFEIKNDFLEPFKTG